MDVDVPIGCNYGDYRLCENTIPKLFYIRSNFFFAHTCNITIVGEEIRAEISGDLLARRKSFVRYTKYTKFLYTVPLVQLFKI